VSLDVKICGLTEPEGLRAAIDGGARWVGFVFFSRSPRHVTPDAAASLAAIVPAGVETVGLFVDPDDTTLAATLAHVRLDLLQLHGHETPERVAEIRSRFGVPVMRALGVAGPEDLDAARAFEPVADRLLFDARPPKGATIPGGNGVSFDWSLPAGRVWSRPWMLAGGLTPANVREAARTSGALAADVSSGVEDRPGHKDPALVRAFLDAARSFSREG